MSKKLIFGIIMAILIIIIGLTFGISSIVKFTRMQILISDVKENILKNNYYLKIQTNYRGETQEIEAFYRDGIGKQKSEEGWYTWTDGKKAYLVDEDKKYLKELSIEDDIQLLVTSTRLISLYPTISNNAFERFFIMGNIENKIKTDLIKIDKLIAEYNYSTRFEFYCTATVTESRIEEYKKFATVAFYIRNFDVKIIKEFLKSIFLLLESIKYPSSKTFKKTYKNKGFPRGFT